MVTSSILRFFFSHSQAGEVEVTGCLVLPTLWLQDQLSGRLSAFDVLSRLHDIAELIYFVDLDIETVLLDEVPQLLGGLLQLLAGGDVVEERWAD